MGSIHSRNNLSNIRKEQWGFVTILRGALPIPHRAPSLQNPTRERQAMKSSGCIGRRGYVHGAKHRESPTPRVAVRNASDLGSRQMRKDNGTLA